MGGADTGESIEERREAHWFLISEDLSTKPELCSDCARALGKSWVAFRRAARWVVETRGRRRPSTRFSVNIACGLLYCMARVQGNEMQGRRLNEILVGQISQALENEKCIEPSRVHIEIIQYLITDRKSINLLSTRTAETQFIADLQSEQEKPSECLDMLLRSIARETACQKGDYPRAHLG